MKIGILSTGDLMEPAQRAPAPAQAWFAENLAFYLGNDAVLLAFGSEAPPAQGPAIHMPALGPSHAALLHAWYGAWRQGCLPDRYDILCAGTLEATYLALALRAQGRVDKVVHIAHDLYHCLHHWGQPFTPDDLAKETHALEEVDAVIVPSQRQYRNLLTYYPLVPQTEVRTILNGVPIRPNQPFRSTALPRDDGRLIVVMAMPFVPQSDYHTAIYTIRRLLAYHRHVLVKIAGETQTNPEAVESLMRTAAALGVLAHIELVGHQDYSAMPDFYASGDVTLVTAVAEGFGNTGVESLMAGVPVVACDSGALPELIAASKQCGAIVPLRSPWAMAEKVVELYSSFSQGGPEERSNRREALRARAQVALSALSWDSTVHQYQALFTDLFDPHRAWTLRIKRLTNEMRERLRQRMWVQGVSLQELARRLGRSYEAVRRIFDQDASAVVRWSTFERIMHALEYQAEEIDELRRLLGEEA